MPIDDNQQHRSSEQSSPVQSKSSPSPIVRNTIRSRTRPLHSSNIARHIQMDCRGVLAPPNHTHNPQTRCTRSPTSCAESVYYFLALRPSSQHRKQATSRFGWCDGKCNAQNKHGRNETANERYDLLPARALALAQLVRIGDRVCGRV